MKRILIILAILAVAFAGCAAVSENPAQALPTETPEIAPAERTLFEYDVRLTADGFDADSLTVRQGESLTIYIVDDVINGHYLTMGGARLSEKQLYKGDKINVPFDEPGDLEIIDENSKESLIINVE